MTPNINSYSIEPLSVGNVVSVGVRLCRSNFKTYLQLALIANLWILVPIYGWAKSAAISGLISRLAFSQLINQPISVSTARSQIKPRLWSFLMVSFQVGLRLIGVYLGIFAAGFIVSVIAQVMLRLFFGIIPSFGFNFSATLVILGASAISFSWFYSRWMISEVSLAVGETVSSRQSINRSWELTKGSVFRIQGIVLVAFAVTVPILFLFNYVPPLLVIPVPRDSRIYSIVYAISLITSLMGGAFVMPFWQCIKSVLYYDLRIRREGFGLQLRHPTF